MRSMTSKQATIQRTNVRLAGYAAHVVSLSLAATDEKGAEGGRR